MRTSSFPPGLYTFSIGAINALLAVVLTILSFRYVEPKNCYLPCGASLEGGPCPTGGCPVGEQKAGWPLPVFVDSPGGGSPTSGWGLLGPEDPALFTPLLLDILFYSLIMWLVMCIILLTWRRRFPVKNLMLSLPLNIFLAASLCMFSWSFGAPIGRGHSAQMYIDTPTGRAANMAFFPSAFIPLEELIENYGNPDDLWLMPEGTSEQSATRMVLHWDSIGMFVQLSPVTNDTYTVDKATNVEMIIFPNEEPVIAIDEKPLGEKNIPWTGYGTYRP